MKLNYKRTFLLGFGFLAISLTWSLYNAFVPVFLRKFIESETVIGFLMTIDNYMGLFLQPAFGTLSDRTRTRFGRRMPYLLIGMPVAAVFMSLVPNHWDLASLVLFMVCLNVVMATFRSPTIAMMPDLTPGPLRSKANGIINLMGGLGAILAYFVGSKLYAKNPGYPFYMASILIMISIVILYFNIKERRDSINYDEVPERKKREKVKLNLRNIKIDRNVLFLLLAIFFWFVAYNAVETFFTLYGTQYLHVKTEDASIRFTFFSVSMVIFAIPAGMIATKIGKKKTIIIGLALLILTFGGLLFSTNINTIGYMFIVAGACWALININSYPFVVSMTSDSNIGRYTGYYYLFSSLASIVSPPLVGKLIDWVGFGILFDYSAVGFIIALVFILLVKPPVEGNRKGASPVESLENLDV